jgi:hypothetical protein
MTSTQVSSSCLISQAASASAYLAQRGDQSVTFGAGVDGERRELERGCQLSPLRGVRVGARSPYQQSSGAHAIALLAGRLRYLGKRRCGSRRGRQARRTTGRARA